jgi:hypothetical protein
MAKRNVTAQTEGAQDVSFKTHRIDDTTRDVFTAVIDQDVVDKLDEVIAAVEAGGGGGGGGGDVTVINPAEAPVHTSDANALAKLDEILIEVVNVSGNIQDTLTEIEFININTDAAAVSVDNIDQKLNSNNSGELKTSDTLTLTTGVQGSLTVGTSAVEVKVGASALTDRKSLSCRNNSAVTMFWGYSSGVTTSNGIPLYPQELITWNVSDVTPIYIISGTASMNARVAEAG